MPYPSHGAQCQQLLAIVKEAFLNQMVEEQARIAETKSSILDLFLTNIVTLINQTRVIPGISDHEAVFIESSLRPIKNSPSHHRVYKYQRIDYNGFRRVNFENLPEASASRQQKLTFRLSGYHSRPQSTCLWKNKSLTKQYVVTRI